MTLGAIITLVEQRLGATDLDIKFDRRLIKFNLSRVWSNLVHDFLNRKRGNIDSFSKTVTGVAIDYYSASDSYSSALVDVIQLQNRSSGVVNISTESGKGIEFVMMTEKNARYYASTEAFEVGNVVYYTVKNETVEYWKGMTPTIASSTVRMSLVQPLTSYSDTDTVHVPQGKEIDLVNAVVEFMLGTPPDDTRVKKA